MAPGRSLGRAHVALIAGLGGRQDQRGSGRGGRSPGCPSRPQAPSLHFLTASPSASSVQAAREAQSLLQLEICAPPPVPDDVRRGPSPGEQTGKRPAESLLKGESRRRESCPILRSASGEGRPQGEAGPRGHWGRVDVVTGHSAHSQAEHLIATRSLPQHAAGSASWQTPVPAGAGGCLIFTSLYCPQLPVPPHQPYGNTSFSPESEKALMAAPKKMLSP